MLIYINLNIYIQYSEGDSSLKVLFSNIEVKEDFPEPGEPKIIIFLKETKLFDSIIFYNSEIMFLFGINF